MNKVTEHKTLFAYNAEQLDALIASAIKDDWQPIGGVTAASEPGRGVVLYRAMVKCEAPSGLFGREADFADLAQRLEAKRTETDDGEFVQTINKTTGVATIKRVKHK